MNAFDKVGHENAGIMRELKKSRFYEPVVYGILGLLNTCTDMLVFTILTIFGGIAPVTANVVSFSLGALQGYFLSSWIAFPALEEKRDHKKSGVRFFQVILVCMGISSLVVWVLAPIIGPLPAKIASIGATYVTGYVLHKFYTFR